jgi:ubiquinone/menaquinone biosynthesis C-methylase UbiE
MPEPDASVRLESAVREHYETTANFDRRRGMSEYAEGPTAHRLLVNEFTWAPDAIVVDAGCGDGVWAAAARSRTPDGRVVGLDASAGMLRAVHERDARVVPVQGDANFLPFAGQSIDVVLALWMLYHVDPARALPDFVRVLRPGGRCIAATNDAQLLPGLEDVVLDAARDVAGREVRSPLGSLRFNVENGEAVLAQTFSRVETRVHVTDYEIPVPDPILSFVESVRMPAQARLGATFDFDAFLVVLRARLDAVLRRGPIRMTRRMAFFVATP